MLWLRKSNNFCQGSEIFKMLVALNNSSSLNWVGPYFCWKSILFYRLKQGITECQNIIVILDPNCSQISSLGELGPLTRLGLNCVSILTNVTHAEAEAGCEAANMSLWSGHSRSRDQVSVAISRCENWKEAEGSKSVLAASAVITAIMDFRNYLRWII